MTYFILAVFKDMPNNLNRTDPNLVTRVLSYPPYGARERETLENAGHVAQKQN